jgi:NADH-quinone oxidoreductase subunit J
MEVFFAKVAFGIYLLLAVGGGLLAVLSRSLIRALMGLILSLFGVAGFYFLMAAPFVALMQILIYLGAVTILIFLAIMLTRAAMGGEESGKKPVKRILFALMTGIIPAIILATIILKYPLPSKVLPVEVPLTSLGQALLGPYVLAFEFISMVLLVAMAGAVLLAFERKKGR